MYILYIYNTSTKGWIYKVCRYVDKDMYQKSPPDLPSHTFPLLGVKLRRNYSGQGPIWHYVFKKRRWSLYPLSLKGGVASRFDSRTSSYASFGNETIIITKDKLPYTLWTKQTHTALLWLSLFAVSLHALPDPHSVPEPSISGQKSYQGARLKLSVKPKWILSG